MLLTITNTRRPATDLSFLLHKHPDKLQTFSLAQGRAHVFYPESDEARCTAALLLDIDPIGLVRRGPGAGEAPLRQYVNDRPYAASSFLSVAIGRVLSSALSGKSVENAQAAEAILPLRAEVTAILCHAGESVIRSLFEPLGYSVEVSRGLLDDAFPDWGESPYYTVALEGEVRLCKLLTHLYVLIPVMDAEKHYWVGDEEVEKLLRHGEGWLSSHPQKQYIAARYLRNKRSLVREALSRLIEDDADIVEEAERRESEEQQAEEEISLNEQRIGAVLSVLRSSGAKRVIDLGCGEGKLLGAMLADKHFQQILGMDVSWRSLEIARERLHLDEMPSVRRERINLIQGSLTYRDSRLEGYDAATCIEVIEHLDPARLSAFERVVFEYAKPIMVVVTTPNADYNVMWECLPAGKMRHRDHRFEWTRLEFRDWAAAIAEQFKYEVRFLPVGPEDAAVGSPTQMGVFTK